MTEPRDQMRQFFFDIWRKHKENRVLEPVETMILDIILLHPEYHALLDHPENLPDIHANEPNPFLHISLHLALREQIISDNPKGIRLIYERLSQQFKDKHLAENRMLECLEKLLWDAKQTDSLPDEQYYLEVLRRIK